MYTNRQRNLANRHALLRPAQTNEFCPTASQSKHIFQPMITSRLTALAPAGTKTIDAKARQNLAHARIVASSRAVATKEQCSARMSPEKRVLTTKIDFALAAPNRRLTPKPAPVN